MYGGVKDTDDAVLTLTAMCRSPLCLPRLLFLSRRAMQGGETALLHAAFNGHADVMNRLIMAGAKREAAEDLDGPDLPALYWDDVKKKVVEKKCPRCRSFFWNR